MAGQEPRVEIDNSANGSYQLTHLMVTMTPTVLNRTVLIRISQFRIPNSEFRIPHPPFPPRLRQGGSMVHSPWQTEDEMADQGPFDVTRRPQPPAGQQTQAPADDKTVIQDVDKVIADAVEAGATDVHFEPLQETLSVRMRIGGALKHVRDFSEKVRTNVLNRLKVQSGMDITKSRVPQSGFLRKEIGDRKIELYVYVMPSLYGESVVVKLQYKQSATMRLNELGMSAATLTAYRKALGRSSGLYLITGPPGSGKRTTVYASILEVLQADMLVMGFDPIVKYEVPGMIQGKPDDRGSSASRTASCRSSSRSPTWPTSATSPTKPRPGERSREPSPNARSSRA